MKLSGEPCLLFPALLVLMFFIAVCGLGVWEIARPPEIGVNKASVSWLPEEASDVSYYESYTFTAYEFTISESGFREWADRWDIQEITGEPARITRYSRLDANRKYKELRAAFDGREMGDSDWEEYQQAEEEIRKLESALISVGLYYHEDLGAGGGISIGYDRELQRAYYQHNPR